MKRACFVCLFQCLTATFLPSQSISVPAINQSAKVASSSVISRSVVSPISKSPADPKAQARILDQYGKLPLSFEPNHGQTDAQVKFLSRTGAYTLFLTGDEAVLTFHVKIRPLGGAALQRCDHCIVLNPALAAEGAGDRPASEYPFSDAGFVSGYRFSDTANPSKPDAPLGAAPQTSEAPPVLRMKLRNANPAAKVTGVDELSGATNYFIGNDPAKWRTSVPTYAKVKYEEIYSGIDLVYYGNKRQLEYDFIVSPGADPHRIAFDVRGAKRIRQDANGDLVFKIGDDEIRWHKPVVYQEKNGARQTVAAGYAITDTNRVGFELAKYDASRPLYIDPLIYSTYLGGSLDDFGDAIVVDSTGNAYIVGSTLSPDFPGKKVLGTGTLTNGTATFTTSTLKVGTVTFKAAYGGDSNFLGSTSNEVKQVNKAQMVNKKEE